MTLSLALRPRSAGGAPPRWRGRRYADYLLFGNWKFRRMSVSTSTGLPLSS